VREVETHKTTMGRNNGLVDLKVGRATRETLDIDTPLLGIDMEGSESATLAKKFDLVDVLIASVVTGPGVALRVFVGHGGA